jgi:hypothetical protein
MQGHKVDNCPIKSDYCYPSCMFWQGKCDYERIIRQNIELIKARVKGKLPQNVMGVAGDS